MDRISFVTLAVNPFWIDQTLLLVESLREFGGQLADAPLKILNPSATNPLSVEFIKKAADLNSEIISIEIEENALRFPLGFLPFAAAAGEEICSGKSELIAWVLPDTLFISPPESFLLPSGKQLGYRPVHHSNIGAEYDQELNEYWSMVYRHCEVPEDRVFPMTTCTRDKILRPYINAGMLVVRPELGFMHAWMEAFRSAYRHPDFQPLVSDQRNAIFLHQAILSGVMMNQYAQGELKELPEAVNYPLHLDDEYPIEHRPQSLNQLITCRFESVKELKEGIDKIKVEEPLASWLETHTAVNE